MLFKLPLFLKASTKVEHKLRNCLVLYSCVCLKPKVLETKAISLSSELSEKGLL